MGLAGKTITLAVTGSIAVYKAVGLASALTQEGARVDVIMTRSATEFVRPLSFQAITQRPVVTEMFDLDAESRVQHVTLGQVADLVLVAPAMESHMYANPATQENLKRLRARGFTILEPEYGRLASGAVGQGRLAEE